MRYRFPYVGADLRKPVLLRDHGYGLVYHAICLFAPPAFAGYSFQPNDRRQSVGLGAWFCTNVVYPSKDGHSSMH